jgi:hypothetical protein
MILFTSMAAMAAAAAPAAAATEDFSTMPVGTCEPDGTLLGQWEFVYNGYGCNSFVSLQGNTALLEQPKTATKPGETHASLVVGPSTAGDLSVQVDLNTNKQLRNKRPHPWEVGWLLWNFTDNVHFYYFIAKPNGWELGKADPAYAGNQRFLATGTYPAFPIGQWYRVKVVQTGGTIQVFVDDALITTFTDTESPYWNGRVGLYTEDSKTYFDNVVITTP